METPRPTVNLAQLRALNNPLRLEIHSRLEDGGPASARELAEQMGLDELRLYYHIKILAKVGLIKAVSNRATATKPEVIYSAADRIWVAGFDLNNPEEADVIIRHGEAMLNLAAKEYREAVETYKADPLHKSTYYRFLMRMSPETRREFDRRLSKLVQWAVSEEAGDGVRFNMTVAISPMVGRKP